jgi:hypothetical protein
MGKKKKATPTNLAGVVVITAEPDGAFGFEIESELSPEVLEAVLRNAADVVSNKVDRAAGAWGR